VGLLAASGCLLRGLKTLSVAFAFCSSGFPARDPACKTQALRFTCTMVGYKRTAETAKSWDPSLRNEVPKIKGCAVKCGVERGALGPLMNNRRGGFAPRMGTNAHEFWGSEIWFVQRALSSLYSTVVRVVDPATAVLKASGTPRPTASVTRVVPCCAYRAFCFSRWQVAAWLGAGRCGCRCPAVLPCGAFARTEDG